MSIEEVLRHPEFEREVDRRARRIAETLLVGPGLQQHLALRGIPADRVQPPFMKWSYPIHVAGALPHEGTFEKVYDDSALLMTFSGSGYINPGAVMPVNLKVDGVQYGTLYGFSNEINSHKSMVTSPLIFPDSTIPTPNILKGTHTVRMEAGTGVASDGNDFFYCWIIETFATTTT